MLWECAETALRFSTFPQPSSGVTHHCKSYKKRIKFRKRGLTKGGVSGNIHGRLERGGRRERLRAKGKKFRKKFLTKRAGCGSIEKLRLRAKGLEREQRVPCKLNNVNQETPWTKEKECFERRAKKQPTEKILELEARSE